MRTAMRSECCSGSVWAMLSPQRATGAEWGNTCDYGAASWNCDHPADSVVFMEHNLLPVCESLGPGLSR